jgi:hypothetical protein
MSSSLASSLQVAAALRAMDEIDDEDLADDPDLLEALMGLGGGGQRKPAAGRGSGSGMGGGGGRGSGGRGRGGFGDDDGKPEPFAVGLVRLDSSVPRWCFCVQISTRRSSRELWPSRLQS